MTKPKRMTAAELMAQLEQDPAWVEQRRLREEKRRLEEEAYARAEAPVVQELRGAGAQISSIWDLVNTKASYPELLPILVNHLQRPYPDAVREGIARALALPEARFAWHLLVRLYRQEPEGQVKHALALAVGNSAGAQELEELIRLARDPQLGESRLLLLGGLERSGDPRAYRALDELATDPDLKQEIKSMLRCRERKQRRQRDQKMTN
jgi:hypothetical protein